MIKYFNSIVALVLNFTRKICVLRYISNIMWKTLCTIFLRCFLQQNQIAVLTNILACFAPRLIHVFAPDVVAFGALLKNLKYFQHIFSDMTNFDFLKYLFYYKLQRVTMQKTFMIFNYIRSAIKYFLPWPFPKRKPRS